MNELQNQLLRALDYDINHRQLLVLLALAHEPINCSKLAKNIKASTAAITGLCDKLQKLGYVERKHSDKYNEDRRTVYISITELGAEIVDYIVSARRSAFSVLRTPR